MKKMYLMLLSLLSFVAWGQEEPIDMVDGYVFTAQTVEGVEMRFRVISQAEKTLEVYYGSWSEPAIDRSTQGTVTVPSKVNGYTVTTIGKNAFSYCRDLQHIILYEGLTSIDSQAFMECNNLLEIEFPQSLAYLSCMNTFYNCNNLQYIRIPDVDLGEENWGTFEGCNKLGTVILECKEVKDWFRGNTSIVNVEIEGSVRKITDEAFRGCSALKRVYINEGVKSIGTEAFANCQNLLYFNIPQSLELEYSQDAYSLISGSILNGCTSLINLSIDCKEIPTMLLGNAIAQSVLLGDNVEVIGEQAFYNMPLTEIFIPKGVRTIEYGAFPNGMKNIRVDADNKTYDSRQNCNALIETASNTLILGGNCSICSIPEGIKCIRANAYYLCDNMEALTLPNGLTEIGMGAFWGCDRLKCVVSNMNQPCQMNGKWDYFSNMQGTLYVPYGTKALYQGAKIWQNFANIVEGAPTSVSVVSSSTSTDFSVINDETDLSGIIIDNVYYTFNHENGDGWTQNSLVLNSVVTDEKTMFMNIEGKPIYDGVTLNGFNGIIFEVAAGSGRIAVEGETKGSHVLNIKIGNREPVRFKNLERGKAEVRYEVEEPCYVLIYATEDGPNNARAIHQVAEAAENSVILYGMDYNPLGDLTGDDVVDQDDITVLIGYIMGKTDGIEKSIADVNGDDKVNIADVTKLIEIINNKASE